MLLGRRGFTNRFQVTGHHGFERVIIIWLFHIFLHAILGDRFVPVAISLVHGSHHNDGQPGVLRMQAVGHFKTGQLGEHRIQDDQIRYGFRYPVQGLIAVPGSDNLMSQVDHQLIQTRKTFRLIIDDQYTFSH